MHSMRKKGGEGIMGNREGDGETRGILPLEREGEGRSRERAVARRELRSCQFAVRQCGKRWPGAFALQRWVIVAREGNGQFVVVSA